MSVKTLHLFSIVIFLLTTISLLFFKERLAFFFHGLDQSFIDSYSGEGFQAYKKAVPAMRIHFLVTFLSTIFCGVISFIAIKHKEEINIYFSTISLALTAIVLVMLVIAFITIQLTGRSF